MLEWIFRRCDGEGEAVETAIGRLPTPEDVNTEGLEISAEAMQALLSVDTDLLREQLPQVKAHLAQFGDKLPSQLGEQLAALESRLG